MKPLLAHTYNPKKITYPCFIQPKLNGIRALYQNGSFQSRDEIPFPQKLLSHISQELLPLLDAQTILDGELYVHGWPLQRINAAVTPIRQTPTADTILVHYHVFDVVDYNSPFSKRFGVLQELASKLHAKPIHIVQTDYVFTNAEANEAYASYVNAGYEGIMYRLFGCPYTHPKASWFDYKNFYGNIRPKNGFLSDKNNRCWHLQKRKSWQDEEFTCLGVIEGAGKREGMVGSFICKLNTNDEAFKVGSFAGFSDGMLTKLLHDPPIGKSLKVKYLCLSSTGVPLNPTLLAIV